MKHSHNKDQAKVEAWLYAISGNQDVEQLDKRSARQLSLKINNVVTQASREMTQVACWIVFIVLPFYGLTRS